MAEDGVKIPWLPIVVGGDDDEIFDVETPPGPYKVNVPQAPGVDRWLAQQRGLAAGDGSPASIAQFQRISDRAVQRNKLDQFLDLLPDSTYMTKSGRTLEALEARQTRSDRALHDLEAAYITGQRFGVPLRWLARHHPDDLPYLRDPAVAEVLMGEADAKANAAVQAAEWKEEIDARAAELLEDRTNGGLGNFLSNLNDFVANASTFGARGVMERLVDGPSEITHSPEDVAIARAQAQQEILGTPTAELVPELEEHIAARTEEILARGDSQEGPIRAGVRPQVTPQRSEEEIAAARAKAELEILGSLAPMPSLTYVPEWRRALDEVTSGLAGGIGDLFFGAMGAIGWTLAASSVPALISSDLWLRHQTRNQVSTIDIMQQIYQRDQDELRTELTGSIDDLTDNRAAKAKELLGETVVDDLIARRDPMMEEFNLMAMGISGFPDPAMAKALAQQFFQMQFDVSPEAQTAALEMVDDLTAQQEDMLMGLDEENFTLNGATNSLIAFYGHNVPMRLATYFSVLVDQEDFLDVFSSDTWVSMHQKAVEHEFSPASVLGVDGSFTGIMVDLFGGIAFDPTTWLFGPRALGGARSVADVSRASRAPVWKKMGEQIVEFMQSPTRGDMAMLSVVGDMSSFGLYDEAASLAMGVSGVGVRRNWLFNKTFGRHTREIPVAKLLERLPEDIVAQARAKLNEVVERNTVAHLEDNPVVLRYNPETRGVTMSVDDVVRMLDADANHGIGAVPAYGQVVRSSVSVRRAELIGRVVEGEGLGVRTLSGEGDLMFSGTHLGEKKLANEVMTGRQPVNGIGLTHDSHRADTFGPPPRVVDNAEAVAGPATRAPISHHLVYNREEILAILPENARAEIAAGGDIGQLFAPGTAPNVLSPGQYAATGPLPKPVGYYSLDELNRARNAVPEFRALPDQKGVTLPALTAIENDLFGLLDMFSKDLLFPSVKEVLPKMMKLMERVLLAGGGNMYPMRTMMALTFAEGFRGFLRSSKTVVGPAAARWFTRQSLTTWMPTEGMGWQHLYRENIVRMWGHDIPAMELRLRQFREVLVGRNPNQVRDLMLDLREAKRALEQMDDVSRGAISGIPDAEPPLLAGSTVEDIARRSEPEIGTEVDVLSPVQEAITDPDMLRMSDDEATLRGIEEATAADEAGVANYLEGPDDVSDPYLGPSMDQDQSQAFADAWNRASPEDRAALDRLVEQIDSGEITPDQAFESPLLPDNPSNYTLGAQRTLFDNTAYTDEAMEAARALEAEQRQLMVLRRDELEQEVFRINQELKTAVATAQREASEAAARWMSTMYDDFNRAYIGTNPYWIKMGVVDDTGFVPWAKIVGEQKEIIPESGVRVTASVAKELKEGVLEGADINKMLGDLADPAMLRGFQAPLAPIDMIAAAELGGARWLQWKQHRFWSTVKDVANFTNRAWMIDKVFKVSTALAVNFDELIRIFHTYGAQAVFRYIEDHIMFMTAKLKAGLGEPLEQAPGKGFGEIWDSSRAIFSQGSRWDKRMRKLQEYPEVYKRMETDFYEHHADSWDDIEFGAPEWLSGMQRFTSNLIESDGFRAAMQGPAEFSRFWSSAEAGPLRTESKFSWGDKRTRLATEEEALQGYETIFNQLLLRKVRPERRYAVERAIREAGRRVDNGEVNVTLAPAILREINIPVRGIRNTTNARSPGAGLSNWFFDQMFMTPTNYRRGFLSDLARTAETARLKQLYHSQGINIIPDWQLDYVAGTHGLRVNAHFGMSEKVEQALMMQNYVTEGTIARLAERRAMAEMEHLMYSWHMTSRAGRSAVNKAAFPFGRPWFDMWSFYGRELLTRPGLRGYLNSANQSKLANAANWANNRLPFNPKTMALVSRTAATDFDTGEVDFSPLLFLPKEGESAFMAIFPGLGLIPMWMGDFIMSYIYDPVDDAEQYQRTTDAIAQFVPSFGYQQVGAMGRLVGGGLLSTVGKLSADLYMATRGQPWHWMMAMFGDIQAETHANRSMKALMADPEEWEGLLAMNETQLEVAYEGLVHNAWQGGALPHGAGVLARWGVPAKFDFQEADDLIDDVWLQAAARFPELQTYRYTPNVTDEFRAQQVDDIRRAYHRLPQQTQDLLITQYPQMAVNLVSGWEWTDKARNEFPSEASVSYSSGGNRADLARHQTMIRLDYIKPLPPVTLLHRIVNTVFSARERLAKQMYTDQVEVVNEYIWNRMNPAQMGFFQQFVDQGIVDATDGQDVWRRFNSLEPQIEEALGENIIIPETLQPWGSGWAGLDIGQFPVTGLRDLVMDEFPESVTKAAAALGIDLELGMTGEQYINSILDVLNEQVSSSALGTFSAAESDTYTSGRSAAWHASHAAVRGLGAGTGVQGNEFQQQVQDFVDYEARTRILTEQDGSINIERAKEVRKRYEALERANPDNNFPWRKHWNNGYASTYGETEWMVPEPPTLSEVTPGNRYTPFIHNIVDGDTLVVSTEETASWLNVPGTRLDARAEGTTPPLHMVRLLGVFAPEMSTEEGQTWKTQLTEAIMAGVAAGKPITLVRDPVQAGARTDFFERELVWLYIGDEPYYYPDTITPGD